MTSDAVNTYLITEYLYHDICMRCGAIHHARPGAGGEDCRQCGGGCWACRTIHPYTGVPWYVQLLDPECPTCRKTLSEVTRIDAQMELFGEVTHA